ncbi:MAG TPA: hypothetical protein VFA20_16790 [Myxococcaceae bacterium]|nr:hypothetical protein [Myxococcaceae bacterium]
MSHGENQEQWSRAQPGLPPADRSRLVSFRYTGAAAFTVVGPITGRRYRFIAPGAVLEVDSRDAPSLATVPRLWWI